MAGRVHHLDRQLAQVEPVAIGIGFIEHRGVCGYVRGIEQHAKDLLHLCNAMPDANGHARAHLDLVGTGQVVSVGMSFQHPLQPQAPLGHLSQEVIDRCGSDGSGRCLIIQHRIDDGRCTRCRISHQIADGMCRRIKQARHIWSTRWR